MNGKVHYWIVCDAVAYIKRYGSPLQKKALQSLQLAYSERKSINDIADTEGIVERIAGFESWHTDKFGDLSLRIPGFLWKTKRNVTGFFGHTFTPFNHFINPHPDFTTQWSTGCGYSYESSSKRGFDSFVIKGISTYLRGLVDKEHSLVLDRIRPAWTQGASEWKQNFGKTIANTTFAPWSVLVNFYYSHFLYNQNEPLEVRGPNTHLVGLQLLGPIFHAVADACSPQHVRPALGFGHQAWENYVQSRVYTGQIDLHPSLIADILSRTPFKPELRIHNGISPSKFDIESFVFQLSIKTAETISKSASSTWRELYKAGEAFWKWYLTGHQMQDDTMYLYNQAVAGTVHTIQMAYEDLTLLGVLSNDGLASPAKLPRLELIQEHAAQMPMRKVCQKNVPVEETRPDPLSKTEDILGFEPSAGSEITKLVSEYEILFMKSGGRKQRKSECEALLNKLEYSIGQEFAIHSRQNALFCPLRTMEHIPIDCDVSAHFGLETFRLPGEKECENGNAFAEYIDKLEDHSEIAHRLELTVEAASLTHIKNVSQLSESGRSKIEAMLTALHHERDDQIS